MSLDTPYRETLIAAFTEAYGGQGPTHLVRAPGRVNLMGDHIDYHGLSVLPMALQRHVALAYREREDAVVRITSTRPQFEARSFELRPTIEAYAEGDWGNYLKAAGQALKARFRTLNGFDGVIHSDIPIAAGLSSSSALVVASALALLHANGIEMERLALAELLAEAERYVGTRGGGMDQAICLAARRHSASRVDFQPLRLTAHPIPPEWHLIVAFSLIPAEKSGAAREVYNTRPRESAEALARVALHLELEGEVTYPRLTAAYAVDDLLRAGQEALDEPLSRRFRHVATEAERVRRAEQALASYDLRGFGNLLNESHASLRDDLEVSHPALDELARIARRAGSAGVRLTGAGLGGCVVALCTESRTAKVLDALERRFYADHEYSDPLEELLFVAEPSGGATVVAIG